MQTYLKHAALKSPEQESYKINLNLKSGFLERDFSINFIMF